MFPKRNEVYLVANDGSYHFGICRERNKGRPDLSLPPLLSVRRDLLAPLVDPHPQLLYLGYHYGYGRVPAKCFRSFFPTSNVMS